MHAVILKYQIVILGQIGYGTAVLSFVWYNVHYFAGDREEWLDREAVHEDEVLVDLQLLLTSWNSNALHCTTSS